MNSEQMPLRSALGCFKVCNQWIWILFQGPTHDLLHLAEHHKVNEIIVPWRCKTLFCRTCGSGAFPKWRYTMIIHDILIYPQNSKKSWHHPFRIHRYHRCIFHLNQRQWATPHPSTKNTQPVPRGCQCKALDLLLRPSASAMGDPEVSFKLSFKLSF